MRVLVFRVLARYELRVTGGGKVPTVALIQLAIVAFGCVPAAMWLDGRITRWLLIREARRALDG